MPKTLSLPRKKAAATNKAEAKAPVEPAKKVRTSSPIPAVLPPAVPVKDETGDQNYKAMVRDAATTIKGMNENVLDAYWSLGRMVNDIEKTGTSHRYGGHTIDQFSKDLAKEAGQKFSVSSLHKAAKFNEWCGTRTQLDKLVKAGWSWRNVSFISAAQVSDKTRTQLLQRVDAGELEQHKVQDAISAELGLSPRRSGRIKSPVIMIKKFTGYTQNFAARLPLLQGLSKKLNEMPVNKRAVFKDSVTPMLEKLVEARAALDEEIKQLKAVKF